METISKLLAQEQWERRLPALQIARRLVLEKYQIFPFLADAIHKDFDSNSPKEEIFIPGYRARRWRHRARYIGQKISAGEAADLGNVMLNKLKYLRWFSV
jgi:hypothetical protein